MPLWRFQQLWQGVAWHNAGRWCYTLNALPHVCCSCAVCNMHCGRSKTRNSIKNISLWSFAQVMMELQDQDPLAEESAINILRRMARWLFESEKWIIIEFGTMVWQIISHAVSMARIQGQPWAWMRRNGLRRRTAHAAPSLHDDTCFDAKAFDQFLSVTGGCSWSNIQAWNWQASLLLM